MAGYTYLHTSDGYLISTIDGSFIVLAGGNNGGCTVPLPAAALPWQRQGPPPNPITPVQYGPSPGGLIAIPLTLLEQLPDRIPTTPADAPTAYTPVDRLAVVETVLASYPYSGVGTIGCQAFGALQDIVAAIQVAYGEVAGYLRWEFDDDPAWDGHTCVSAGVRYWANIVAYSDGAFYWILGGLGGYGLQAYWVYGGMADPALFVAP